MPKTSSICLPLSIEHRLVTDRQTNRNRCALLPELALRRAGIKRSSAFLGVEQRLLFTMYSLVSV